MMRRDFLGRSARIAVALGLAITLAACAANNKNLAGNAAPGTVEDFVVNVGDRVYFTVDSADLTGTSKATLDKQATWLNQYAQYAIVIEGHADERGTREYNIGLSARRGNAVKDYLASRGVNPSRLRMIPYGKERPVAVCDNESCWSQNRRSVTTVNAAGS